jgi:hypothetical protein
MTVAPAGVATDAAGPTSTMRSSRITTVVCGRMTPASLSKTFPLRITIGPGAGFVRRAARASACAFRQAISMARSVGIASSFPGRVVMNQPMSSAKNSSRASSHTPVGEGAKPDSMTKRTRSSPRAVVTIVSAMISARARPLGKRRADRSGCRKSERASTASSYGVPAIRMITPGSLRTALAVGLAFPPRPPRPTLPAGPPVELQRSESPSTS